MKRLITCLILFCSSWIHLESAESSQLEHQKRNLQKKQQTVEMELIKTGQTYFLCNMPDRRIDLKIRGITLRSWSTNKLKLFGDPIPPKRFDLLAKNAIKTPQRDKIKPGEPPAPAMTQAGKFQLTSFEIDDMPDKFSLRFDGHIVVHIHVLNDTFWGKVKQTLHRFSRGSIFPLRTVFSRLGNHHHTEIEWFMPDIDNARTLFWACYDKSPWLFVIPL